jgi:Fe-coproporphyrin III synthase
VTTARILRIASKIISKRSFIQVTLFVTSRCNLRCGHCFNWRAIDDQARSELSLSEIDRITQGLGNVSWLLISGGEPFLRRDLPEIARLFIVNCGLGNLSIPTNGSLPEQIADTVERILAENPKLFLNVSLSFHGSERLHDAFTGAPGAFAKLGVTYEKLDSLRRRYRNFGLGAVLVQTASNQRELCEVIQFLDDAYSFDSIALDIVRGTPRDPDTAAIDIERFIEAAEWLDQRVLTRARTSYQTLVPSLLAAKDMTIRELIADVHMGIVQQVRCQAGRLSLVIDDTGKVFPCELMEQPLGDLRENDYDIDVIRKSPAYKEFLRSLDLRPCACTHGCNLGIASVSDPALMRRMLGKWVKLPGYRRAIEARVRG